MNNKKFKNVSLKKSFGVFGFRKRSETNDSNLSHGENQSNRSYASSADDEAVYQAFLDGPAMNKKCVVGIDFGTTNSGYAYAMTSDKRIRVVKKKEPTCVLFQKSERRLIEFGLEARNFYRKAQAGQELLTKFAMEQTNWGDDYIYLDQDIKMRLFQSKSHSKEDLEEDGVPVSVIVASILRRIKDTAMERIRKDSGIRIEVSDILWVLTVPSIWKESDKQFMRRAAVEAELIPEEFSSNLFIALESECAAVWTEVTFANLREGETILCLDCGGGTVDISAIKIDKRTREGTGEFELSMSQMLPPTGLSIGSQNIDKRFQKFLKMFLGEENFDRVWSLPDARMELQDGWERVKCSVQANHFSSKARLKQKSINMEITLTELNLKLQDLVERFNMKEKIKQKSRSKSKPIKLEYKKMMTRPSCVLKIPPSLLHHCFDPTILAIIEKTKEVLATNLPDGVDRLVLYGGLGCSDYLQYCIEHNVKKPDNTKAAGLAVMKGAVKYGMFPRIINSRRARMTVGVKVTIPFIRGKHNNQKFIKHKEYDSDRREYFIRDVFKTFVVAGQMIDVNERYMHTFAPASKSKTSVKFELFASSSKKVDFVTEEGCLKLARIVVPIEKGSMRNITLALSFGFTEIRAHILDDQGNVLREVPVQFDRVGENAIISELEDGDRRVQLSDSDL